MIKPEVQIITDALAVNDAHFPSRIEQSEFIWGRLVEYWTNRIKETTSFKPKQEDNLSPVDTDSSGYKSSHNEPVPFTDSYFFESALVPEFHPAYDSTLDTEDIDNLVYENHVRNNVEDISSQLHDISDLPFWTPKEAEKLSKIASKLYKVVA